MMNMAENRNLARFFYTEWHPQIFLTMHQMGSNGPRFFVPPNDDPIDHELRSAHLAHCRAARQRDGARAAARSPDRCRRSNAMYDYYWPGHEDSAPLGHNTVCLSDRSRQRSGGLADHSQSQRAPGGSAGIG